MKNRFKSQEISELFYRSAFEQKAHINNTENILEWVKSENQRIVVDVQKIPFRQLKKWNINDISIFHNSRKFFSIEGLKVSAKINDKEYKCWSQPIINQPEVGFLGFITKSINGVLHFLTQAKIEPGNVNNVQLSPTLQATRSNFTKAHKGKSPSYLDFFLNAESKDILVDQLQSEQGSRFFKKRNRNIIIYTDKEVELKKNFTWLTLAQLKYFMSFDNLVNMDTRTVLSGISFSLPNRIYAVDNEYYSRLGNIFHRSFQYSDNCFYQMKNIHSKISNLKSKLSLSTQKIGINYLNKWEVTDYEIRHCDNQYFKIIGVNVTISNREVSNWSQPMVEPVSHGLSAFISKIINGILHFAVQLKVECGLIDIIELGPTIQTNRCISSDNFAELPFSNFFLNNKHYNVLFDNLQSEEGGRFFNEQNRNMIILIEDQIDLESLDNYVWMTLHQLNSFIKFTNSVNIQARNLVAQTRFIDVE